MSALSSALSKSIGRKLIVALTGLFLVSFLFVHLSGNFQLFLNDGGTAFNTYTKFMTTNPLIRVAELILAAGIIFHVVYAIIVTRENAKARPTQYAVQNTKSSTWSSRNMGILGSVILVFLVVHIAMFWGGYHFPNGEAVDAKTAYEQVWKLTAPFSIGDKTIEAGQYITAEDWLIIKAKPELMSAQVQAISMMKIVLVAFKNPLIVLFYVLSMGVLAFHLAHGFQSAFRSIGFVHKKYTPLIEKLGIALAVLVPLGFASMPILLFLK